MTQEEVARKANIKLTREEEVALYGEHERLKAFYPTAVERLLMLCVRIRLAQLATLQLV